jgi:chromosome segregation ATPase
MRIGRIGLLAATAGLVWLCSGCINVQAPREVRVGGSRERVDSSHTPRTASHEEARRELDKAYSEIRYLEKENRKLHDKADEYKRERDKCRDRLERYEDD